MALSCMCYYLHLYGIQSVTKIGTTNCVRGEVTAPRWGSRIAGWGLGNRCVGTTAQRWCSSITVKVATTAPPTLGLDNRRLVNRRLPCRVSRIVNRESRIATREALVDACRVSRIVNRESRLAKHCQSRIATREALVDQCISTRELRSGKNRGNVYTRASGVCAHAIARIIYSCGTKYWIENGDSERLEVVKGECMWPSNS